MLLLTRSLYDELGGQYNLPRMSDPGAAYNLDSDGYHGNPAGDYHGNSAGDYRGSPAGDYHRDDLAAGYHGDHDDDYGDAAAGGYHADGGGAGYHSDGEFEPGLATGELHGFRTLQPEETNAGLTEMVDTPRQHLDTSGEWRSDRDRGRRRHGNQPSLPVGYNSPC